MIDNNINNPNENILYIIYSHSSYSDILNIQNDYISDIKEEKILFIDKLDENIKYNFDRIILYDDNLNYSKRLYNCLEIVNTVKFIIFLHDNDIILYKSQSDLNNLIKIMKVNYIDRIDLQIKDIPGNNIINYNEYILIKNNNINNYIYNVNPSIWRYNKFKELMNNFNNSYVNIEHACQEYCYNNLNVYTLYSKNIIRCGFHNLTNIFVFLHITKNGELTPVDNNVNNLDKNIQEIYDKILNKYNISRKIRPAISIY